MPRDKHSAEHGFTLIVVLWVVALLTLILTGFLRSTGTHTGIAANAVASARAESLADAGIHLAVLDLIQAARNPATFRNSGQKICRAGPGETIAFLTEDAAGRVDLNRANQDLLAALLAGLGSTAAEATAGAAAIIDFRDRDNDPLPGGAEVADYVARGLKFVPKNAPFDTVEELEHVFGFTSARVKSLMPHVTVHSGISGVDPLAASPTLMAHLQTGHVIVSSAGLAPGAPGNLLPSEFAAKSPRQTFILTSAAETHGGGRYVREAVVELSSRRSLDYAFRAWKRGDDFPATKPAQIEPPACAGLTG